MVVPHGQGGGEAAVCQPALQQILYPAEVCCEMATHPLCGMGAEPCPIFRRAQIQVEMTQGSPPALVHPPVMAHCSIFLHLGQTL